jgi:hypothetical protein
MSLSPVEIELTECGECHLIKQCIFFATQDGNCEAYCFNCAIEEVEYLIDDGMYVS